MSLAGRSQVWEAAHTRQTVLSCATAGCADILMLLPPALNPIFKDLEYSSLSALAIRQIYVLDLLFI